MVFLGELFINLPLPVDQPIQADCGTCTACRAFAQRVLLLLPIRWMHASAFLIDD